LVGRVALRAPSHGLEKAGYVEKGRFGARGATRPT
jgi:hypothetical protein